MLDINKKPASSDALLYVYENTCVLNSRLVKLLDIQENDMVKFTYDYDEMTRGRIRTYITKVETGRGYRVHRKVRSFRVYSTSLCSSLASYLDGYGTYRVCPEIVKEESGRIYYEIFFKKY